MKESNNIEESPNLTHLTIVGGMWQSFSVIGYAILQLVVLSILARLVSPVEFGVIAIANIVAGFVLLFSQIGLGLAIIQRRSVEECHTTTAFTVSVLLGIGCVILLWIIAPSVAVFFESPESQTVLRAISFSFFFNSIGAVPSAMLQKELRFKTLMWVQLSTYFLSYVCVAIPLALLGRGVWALVAGISANALANSFLIVVASKWRISFGIDGKALKELISYGGGATIMKLFSYLSYQIDYVVTGRLLGIELLGLYERAFSLMLLPGRYLGEVLDRVLFPAMSQIQSNTQRLSNAYLRSIELSNLLLLPLSILMVIWAENIVGLLLGSQWLSVVLPFQLLAVAISLRVIGRMSEALIHASGKVYLGSVVKIGYFILVLLGSWIGAAWGIAGVAAAVSLATLVNFAAISALCIYLVQTDVYEYIKRLWPGVFNGIIYLVINLFLQFFLSRALISSHLSLLVVLIVNGIVFFLIGRYRISWLGQEFLWLLGNIVVLFPVKMQLVVSKLLLEHKNT
jgi:O-antigen/teichoic acid export membrane protein